MKLRLIVLVVASTLAASCSLWGAPQRSDAPAFRYGLRGAPQAGVVQAFNKGGKTYVQFLDLDRAKPSFVGEEGQALTFESRGQYAVLAGELDSVAITATGGQVLVYALDRRVAKRPPVLAVVTAAASAASQATSPADPSTMAAVTAPARAVPIMRTTFNFDTSQWTVQSLSKSQRLELLRMAEAFKSVPAVADGEIRVIGHADPRGTYCGNMKLSYQRAESIAFVLRAAGLEHVKTYGRGPLDAVPNCLELKPAQRDECLRASRRVVIELGVDA